MACVTQHLRTWHRVPAHLQQGIQQGLPWVPRELASVRFPKMPFAEPLRLAMDAFGRLYALNRLHETVHQWIPDAGEWQRALRHVANPRDVAVVPLSCGMDGGALVVAEALGSIGLTQAHSGDLRVLIPAKWNSATSGLAVSHDGMLVHLDGCVGMCYVRSLETTAVLHSWSVPEWQNRGHHAKAIVMVHQNKVAPVHHSRDLTVNRCLSWGIFVAICWCTPFRVTFWLSLRSCIAQKDAV